MEAIGTTCLVSKKDQVKFYAQPELVDRFSQVLESQGLSLTEGLTRLMELALLDPESLSPLLFRQVQGDVARAIARHVLRKKPVTPTEHKQDAPVDDINVVLDPRPFLKKKRGA